LHLTLYRGLTFDEPVEEDSTHTLETLAEKLKALTFKGPKAKATLWAAHELAAPWRLKENIKLMHELILDFDGLTDDEFDQAAAALAPYRKISHSTASSKPGAFKFRSVIELKTPIDPQSWPDRAEAFARSIGIWELLDQKALRNVAQHYFVPTVGEDNWFDDPAGDIVLELLTYSADQTKPEPIQHEPSEPVDAPAPTREHIEATLTRWAREDNDRGKLAKAIKNGEPWDEQGERAIKLHSIVCSIVSLHPFITDDLLIEILMPSIEALALRDGDETVDYWIERALKSAINRDFGLEKYAERKAQHEHMISRLLAQVTRSELINGKYPPEDLAQWAEEQGCTVEEFAQRWIVSFKGANWIFHNGRYAPAAVDKDAMFRAVTLLAPAPVDLWVENKEGGRKLISLATLRLKYGLAPSKAEGSIIAARSYYERDEDTFVEALAPLRKITPRFHQEIHDWIELFLPLKSDRDLFLDWMATITQVDKSTCALYLWGKAGCGKSLTGAGVSRLWTTTGPADGDNFFDRFNSLIIDCPLIYIDEKLPEIDGFTSHLRRLLGNNTFRLERKFLPAINVRGYPRVLITANTPNMIEKLREDVNADDVDAIAQRIAILQVSEKAAPYLLSLGKKTRNWIEGDQFAEHMLWLRDNRKVAHDNRRWIVSPSTINEAHAQLTMTGPAREIALFLVRALEEISEKPTISIARKIRAGNGELQVEAGAVRDALNWRKYVGEDARYMNAFSIGKGLQKLGEQYKPNRGSRYYKIRLDLFYGWIERNGFGDRASIQAMIEKKDEH